MSTVNQKAQKEQKEENSHLNFMAGKSFFVNPLTTLQMAASSSFFGEPQYYHREAGQETNVSKRDSSYLSASNVSYLSDTLNCLDPQEWRNKTPREIMEDAIDKALDYDEEETLKFAEKLRQEGHIRVTPQVILVRAAHHKDVKGTQLIGRYAPGVFGRVDDVINGLAYHYSAYGKDVPIPNSLKRVWKKYLEGCSEYSLSKYKLEGHEVNLYDIVNLTHPKSDAIDKLMKGKLKLGDDKETWESLISREGSTLETWTKALEVMGHMALLRNLRNLLKNRVDSALFCDKLVNGAQDGKQLPFRYYSAYKAIEDVAPDKLLIALDESMLKCLTGKGIPHFPGRTICLTDNSGSAQGATTSSMGSMRVSEIANLTGIIIGMLSDQAQVGVFGDNLVTHEVIKGKSVLRQVENLDKIARDIGQGTENGIWIFFREALAQKAFYDNIFVMSDMQAGHGGLYGINPGEYNQFTWNSSRNIDVSKLVAKYRKEVNKDVNVFLIQVAGYTDTIMPETYDRTYILGGWSEGVLRYAESMIKARN